MILDQLFFELQDIRWYKLSWKSLTLNGLRCKRWIRQTYYVR